MSETTEKMTVTLNPGFQASVAIDGFGKLERDKPKTFDAPPHVARFFRASTMFTVNPATAPKAEPAKKATKKAPKESD